jgi:hypothetical protein
MRGSIRIAAATAAVLLLLPGAVAQASPQMSLYLNVETTLGSPSGGPFWATGVAVDNGVVCGDGWTVDVSVTVTGGEKSGHLNYQVLKSFVCNDGSGSMLLKLQAHSDPDRGGDYAWSIAGGTGAYAGLRGTGTGYSVPADYGINDLLFGAVH